MSFPAPWDGGAPSLSWLQLSLEEQDVVPLRSQVNAAARRVDVLVGEGLRAAVQPDDEAATLTFHGALKFSDDAGEDARRSLLARLEAEGAGIDYGAVGAGWLAFRRVLPAAGIDTADALGERLQGFLTQALGALERSDVEGIL